MDPISSVDAVIPAGATGLSGVVDLGYGVLQGFIMPGTWIAAALTFQASLDGENFYNLYDNGTEVNMTVGVDRFVQLDPVKWQGIRYLKLRSGTAATPVNQTASRTIKLIVRPLP